jgi:hypothetical protein
MPSVPPSWSDLVNFENGKNFFKMLINLVHLKKKMKQCFLYMLSIKMRTFNNIIKDPMP